jgi:hypothetical protein
MNGASTMPAPPRQLDNTKGSTCCFKAVLIVRLVRLAIQEIAQYWLSHSHSHSHSHRPWLASHCRFPAQLTLRCFLATTAYAFLSLSLHRVAPDRRRQLSGCSEN